MQRCPAFLLLGIASHCAALAVFCTILGMQFIMDLFLFLLVQVTSGLMYACSYECQFLLLFFIFVFFEGEEVQDEHMNCFSLILAVLDVFLYSSGSCLCHTAPQPYKMS